jgi:putative transposase
MDVTLEQQLDILITTMEELPQRSRLGHGVPSWVSEGAFFFLTINCVPRHVNQLCHCEPGDAVLRSAAYQHRNLFWYCRLLLLMPDHLHAILAFSREPGMKAVVTNWKHFLARKPGITWQRDFFDHRLRDRYEEAEKFSYILLNPVRSGLCDRAEDWPWILQPNDRIPPRV